MRQQRRYLAAKHAVEQAATFALLPVCTAQQRRIQIAPAILLGAYCTLAEQAIEQGLDGFFVPAGGLKQGRDDLFGSLWRLLSQQLQDPAFGLTDDDQIT